MILTLTLDDKVKYPKIFRQMFESRAEIFHERLRWNVQVQQGLETDIYDHHAKSIYLAAVNHYENLLGSLRLLATTGPTMLQNEFAPFFDESIDVSGPTIWECTKFCVLPDNVSRESGTQTSNELLIRLCELCLASGIEYVVGVYDMAMSRIYKRIGWSPEPIAQSRPEIGNICVGIWQAPDECSNSCVVKSVILGWY